jgi:hypothetical protein
MEIDHQKTELRKTPERSVYIEHNLLRVMDNVQHNTTTI